MNAIRVYDWPTRLFHWLFAGFFVTAFAIANLVDDDSARFSLHMLAGLGMVFVVVLRLAWSTIGTRHARLGDLTLAPRQLGAYLKSIVTGGGRQWAGHNPASSWAAVAMVGLAIGLGVTGWLMATGAESDALEEAHELMANGFLAIVLLHVGGVLVHMLRHRDRLAASMVTGTKQLQAGQLQPGASEPVRSRPLAGLAFGVLLAVFAGHVTQNYDAQARTLQLFGTTMQLGEDGHDGGHGRERGHRSDDD